MTENDVNFNLGSPKRRPTAADSPADIPEEIADDSGTFTLYVSDTALIGIRKHASTDPNREVGGVLVGNHYKRGERTVVMVNEHLPLPTSSASRTHYTYGDESFRHLHQSFRPTPDRYVVGWFHSHPKLGDPFMSSMDEKVHKENFREPWHVSIVVAAGEWLMPIGCWRMEGSRLIEIKRHYVQMTPAVSVAEQSRRFIQVCVSEDRRPLNSIANTVTALSKIAATEESVAWDILNRMAEEMITRPQRGDLLGVLEAAIELAIHLSESPENLEPVKFLGQQLSRIQFQEDHFRTVGLAEKSSTSFALVGNRCFSLKPLASIFLCYDLITNTLSPINISQSEELIDMSESPQGDLWLLSKSGRIAKIPRVFEIEFVGVLPIESLMFNFEGLPIELSVGNDTIWLRTSTHIHQLSPIENARTGGIVSVKKARLPRDNSVLLRPPIEDCIIISADAGQLHKINEEGNTTMSVALPAKWTNWNLVQACSTPAGILLLFDNGVGRTLVHLDSNTMSLIAYYVQADELDPRGPLMSITVDTLGRVYSKKGSFVYLFTESGIPDPTWYLVQKTADLIV